MRSPGGGDIDVFRKHWLTIGGDSPLSAPPATFLDEVRSKSYLERHGLPVPRGYVGARHETVSPPADFGEGPFAIKAVAADIAHKNRAGALALDVGRPDVPRVAAAVLDAANAVSNHVRGILVEPMVTGGQEWFVGGGVNAELGPYLVLGPGGVDVEYHRGAMVFLAAPVTDAAIERALTSLTHEPGLRAVTAAGLAAMKKIVLALAGADGLLLDGHVTELDLNPVITTADAAAIVDARIAIVDDGRTPRQPSATRLTDAERAALRKAAYDDLLPAFEPATLAVVGASAQRFNMGTRSLKQILDYGYAGRAYPVHPAGSEILGIPAVPSIAELPEGIDKALVAVPAQRVPAVLRQLADRHTRTAQILTSGFAEFGTADGARLESEIVDICASSRMRVLGPNSLGVYSPRGRQVFRAPRFATEEAGVVAFVSQSGSFAGDLVANGTVAGLRFSRVISAGNCTDVRLVDYLRFLEADDGTELISFYVETAGDAGEFVRELSQVTKPVVILRGGGTSAGSRAAASHTAALGADGTLWNALLRSSGAVLVDTFDDLLDALLAAQCSRGRRAGRDVAIIAQGGGGAVAAADQVERHGLRLADLPVDGSSVLSRLRGTAGSSVVNPLDLNIMELDLANGELCSLVREVGAVPGVTGIVIVTQLMALFSNRGSPAGARQADLAMENIAKGGSEVAVPVSMALRTIGDAEQDDYFRAARQRLASAGVAVYRTIEQATRSPAVLSDIHRASAQ